MVGEHVAQVLSAGFIAVRICCWRGMASVGRRLPATVMFAAVRLRG